MAKSNVFKVALLTTIAFIASFSATTAWAQGGSSVTAQAFAIFYGTHITGSRANIWTAQQPANWWAIASPVAVCTTQPNCTGYLVETGFVKGTVTPTPNVLQQFVSWWGLGVPADMDFVGIPLQDNTWYEFRVEQCDLGTTNWCAYIGNTNVHTFTNLGFNYGLLAGCGGEGGGGGVPMGVYCYNPQWRDTLANGLNWNLYNYNYTQINSLVPPHQYCVLGGFTTYGSYSYKCN